MGKVPDSARITITVSRGMVQKVFISIPLDLEVDILDFDGEHSKEELEDYETYVAEIRREQTQLL